MFCTTSDSSGIPAADLIAPVALDQISAVDCQCAQKSLSAELAHRTTGSEGILAAHAKLDMSDTYSKKNTHGVVQIGAIAAIELSDGRQDEGVRNVLEEVHVAATIEEEWVRSIGISGIVFVRLQLAAYPLLVFDALVDDAIAEKEQVGCKRKGPGAGDGYGNC